MKHLFMLSLLAIASLIMSGAGWAVDIQQLRYTQNAEAIEFVFGVSDAVNPTLYERKRDGLHTLAVRIKEAKNHIKLTPTYKKKTWLMDISIKQNAQYVEYTFSAKKPYAYNHRYLPADKKENKGRRYVLEIAAPAVKPYTVGFQETLPSTAVAQQTTKVKHAANRHATIDKAHLHKAAHTTSSQAEESSRSPSKSASSKSTRADVITDRPAQRHLQTTQARKIIVAIDAGHGGKDPGAIGQGGTYEKHIVLSIAQKVYDALKTHRGFEPQLIRSDDEYVSLTERRKIAANTFDADFFLSIHADAAENKSAKGASVYILSTSGASSASARYLAQIHNKVEALNAQVENELLALLADITVEGTVEHSHYAGEAVLSELKKLVPLHKNTVEHAGFAVLKNSRMVSLLVETGFISNKSEERKLKKEAHQNNLAKAIVKGLESYYEKYPEPNTYFAAKQQAQGEAFVYVVQAGDNLTAIANRNNVSVKQIKSLNDLSKDTIFVGQKLKIPL